MLSILISEIPLDMPLLTLLQVQKQMCHSLLVEVKPHKITAFILGVSSFMSNLTALENRKKHFCSILTAKQPKCKTKCFKTATTEQ